MSVSGDILKRLGSGVKWENERKVGVKNGDKDRNTRKKRVIH